jgi:pilus assembly protein CpaE
VANKILVVDDDLDTLRLVGLMLERQGYQIVAASSGHQALALAKAELPDLVLLDIMMPDIDGFQVTRQLRADPTTQDMLIIMFTAKGQMEEKLEGFEAGADDYLTKPTQPRELVAHVRAVLKRGKRPRAPAPRDFREHGRVIGLISAKGGVGVSTLALNLGVALYHLEKKTVVVADFRPGCGTIGLELGYSVSQGLNQLLMMDAVEIDPYIIEAQLTSHSSGVRFLFSSSQPQDACHLSAVAAFEAIAKHLSKVARYILLDLAPSLTPVNNAVINQCDQIVLVTEPVAQTATQTKQLFEHLVEKGVSEEHMIFVLVNRLRSGIQLSLGQVQDQLGHGVSVVFTAAAELAYQAQLQNVPMILLQPDGVSAQQYTSLAEKVKERHK